MLLRATITAAVLAATAGIAARQAIAVDVSRIGPQVGAAAPAFTGVDQFGKTHTLSSSSGPKGTMLVFFRSADW
jgi:peroxiredoxin Q/BCP